MSAPSLAVGAAVPSRISFSFARRGGHVAWLVAGAGGEPMVLEVLPLRRGGALRRVDGVPRVGPSTAAARARRRARPALPARRRRTPARARRARRRSPVLAHAGRARRAGPAPLRTAARPTRRRAARLRGLGHLRGSVDDLAGRRERARADAAAGDPRAAHRPGVARRGRAPARGQPHRGRPSLRRRRARPLERRVRAVLLGLRALQRPRARL